MAGELPCCETVARVVVPSGARAVVVSDLFLTGTRSEASGGAALELAAALAASPQLAAIVVAGNLFDLLTPGSSPKAALEAHHELAEALRRARLARPGGAAGARVLLLPGVRDRAVLYDPAVAAELEEVGIEVAQAAELELETPGGPSRVRVEPGWRFDPRTAFADPSNPHDTPLADHALREVFPALSARGATWLAGIDRLADPSSLPRFVASRLAYRRLAPWLWWLLVPVAVGLLSRFPDAWLFGMPHRLGPVAPRLLAVALSLALELLAVVVVAAILSHRLWRDAASPLLGPGASEANDTARAAARALIADGAAGLVTGHTLQAELARVGTGFYANTGACGEVVDEHRARLGLPSVFLHQRRVSYIELEAAAELRVRLLEGREDLPAASALERLASGRRRRAVVPLRVVAAVPGGADWPPVRDPARRLRTVRRLAAAGIALLGVADVVSAIVPPQLRGRLHPILGYVPLGISEAAGALVALAGIGLLALSRGVRRGQRLAWAVAVGLLAGTVVLHLLHAAAIAQSLAALVLLALLLAGRGAFRARFDPPSLRRGLVTLAVGALGIALLAATVLEALLPLDPDRPSIPFPRAVAAAAERLIGIRAVPLPPRVDAFVSPVLLVLGLGLAALALLLALRPVVARRDRDATAVPAPSAREVVREHGRGTLDYFALRDDKHHFLAHNGLVAYATYGGVCLVSPDPICAPEERERLWTAFRRHADEHGWAVAVLGASEEWLPVYRRSGMRDLYIGDEAVVDVRSFSLEGGARKGLRQAVNRIANHGYTVSFHDPATVDRELAAELREVMTKNRRGGAERGFSMTLGRLFDPRDTGLLLAVAHDPAGRPVAFCQFVPAPGIGGFSLDLMRRDDGDHPNGLLDFLLVRTIERLRELGYERLDLNFATLRAVLAGEAGDGVHHRLERWVLRRLSDTMQIESLWRFNAKYGPAWLPRYVAWDAAETSLATALAIARAESFVELPVIGRFLAASHREPRPPSPALRRRGAPRGRTRGGVPARPRGRA
jgi:lysylphosphatidylglycerol synthetase-like protein (DUF2156 family)